MRQLRALLIGIGLALGSSSAASAGPPALPPLPPVPQLPTLQMQTWLVTVRATQVSSWTGTGTDTPGDCTRLTTAAGEEGFWLDTPHAVRIKATRVGGQVYLSGTIPVRGLVDRRARYSDRITCPEESTGQEGEDSGCGPHPFSGIVNLVVDVRTKRLGVALQSLTGVPALEYCKPAFGVLFPGLVQATAPIRISALFGDADVLRFPAVDGRIHHETQLHLKINGHSFIRWEVEMFPTIGDPVAVPGTYRPVTRGGTVRLDGSRSRAKRGRIVKHRWTFAPGAGCPPGVQLRSGGKNGARARLKLLCPLVATLTVTDDRGRTDARSTRIGVTARKGEPWKTVFTHRRELATSARGPVAPPAIVAGAAISLTGGVNTTDCGEEAPGSMILCPAIGGLGSWRGKSYELQRLEDPGGPFDGSWYVASAAIDVKRVALINPTITPGVAVLPRRGSFYDENLARGNPVAAFLEAVEQHEGYGKPGAAGSGHSEIIRDLVTGELDPRKRAETLFAASESGAQRAVDDALHEIDAKVDSASNDPLPQIWSGGPLVFWDESAAAWTPTTTFHVP